MIPAIIDTDIFSEPLRARNEAVLARASEYRAAHHLLTITAPTAVELIHGYHAAQREDRVLQLQTEFEAMEVLPLTTPSAVLAGRIMGDLRRRGQSIGAFDPLIAAIAIMYERVLVTGNTRHYQRILDLGYDLRVDDWRDSASS